jgi:hypothetical protein
MSHQDKKSEREIVVNCESLGQVADSLFPRRVFQGLKTRKGATWSPRMLVVVALFWALSSLTGLKERFAEARKIAAKIFRWLPAPGATYVGFQKQLKKWHAELQAICMRELRVRMREDLFGRYEVAGYVVIAADGSRIELARTTELEGAFAPQRKKKGKGGGKRSQKKGKSARGKSSGKRKRQSAASIAKKINSPQMWLTLLWHVGTGLPWAWRTGPSDSSEREHLLEMLPELPENALITADAGFVGYDFWSALIAAGHRFVIRVGANVKLLKKLGYAREYDNTVYLWPDSAAKKKLPPLVLRLVQVHNGKHPMYLITNVLSKSRLSDQQIVKIYKARWGVELFFRTFKQTFGRHKLRSHTPDSATMEADWSLIALWAVCLLAQREIVQSRGDPARLSAAGAIKAIQQAIRHYRNRPDSPQESLQWMFRHALLDDYERTSSKIARAYPRKKQRERTGVAKTNTATKTQVAAAATLKKTRPEFRLTA